MGCSFKIWLVVCVCLSVKAWYYLYFWLFHTFAIKLKFFLAHQSVRIMTPTNRKLLDLMRFLWQKLIKLYVRAPPLQRRILDPPLPSVNCMLFIFTNLSLVDLKGSLGMCPPRVQFLSFSRSFRQKFCQIIGWRTPMGLDLPPPGKSRGSPSSPQKSWIHHLIWF